MCLHYKTNPAVATPRASCCVGGDPDAELWTGTGAAPGTEFAAGEPPDAFPLSAPTMNVAMEGGPTRVWPRPGLPLPIPPDAWEPWKRHSEQGLKGLIDAWRSLFKGRLSGSGGGRNYDPDWDEEWKRARELCRNELAKPYPSRTITGGHRDVENCARGHVSERCRGNSVDYGPDP